jgi:hypothetical protein
MRMAIFAPPLQIERISPLLVLATFILRLGGYPDLQRDMWQALFKAISSDEELLRRVPALNAAMQHGNELRRQDIF